MKKDYIRDKRSPIPKHENVSRIMSANKGKNTKPEISVRKELWKNGIRGYRLNWKKVPGRPDIAFPNKKIAIFIMGCFWHRCPKCSITLPKHNTEFWRNKFNANVIRDEKKKNELQMLGWAVVVIWECEINSGLENIVFHIRKLLHQAFDHLNSVT